MKQKKDLERAFKELNSKRGSHIALSRQNYSYVCPRMQPYRTMTSNQFLPIYWTECQQCPCENCLSRESHNTSSSPSLDAEVRRPSFTIESLLSRKDERKSDLKPPCAGSVSLNVALVSSSGSGQFASDRSELIHGSGYLTNFRRQSFGLEQVAMLARGNIQTNGKLNFFLYEIIFEKYL